MHLTDIARPEPDALGNPFLIDALREDISRTGGITFARFMEQTLYHPEFGYYLTPRRRPGRSGDFITSPEVHPFFGITIAGQIAEMWEGLGRPDPFVVREEGAGVGGLAYDIIAGLTVHHPDVRSVLQYRLRDVNPYRLAQAMDAMAEVGLDDIVSTENPLLDQRIEPVTGVVLANEVADALLAHQLIWTNGEVQELWVVWNAAINWFGWETRALSSEVQATDPLAWLKRNGVDADSWPQGAMFAWSPALDIWVQSIASGLERGYGLVIDYGYPAVELYREHRLEGTIRCYREHAVSDNPFQFIGEQDVTVHVDFTRIADAATGVGFRTTPVVTQGDFLSRLTLGQHLVDLQQHPETDAAEYYRAQASVLRLIDPAGLGRFRVIGLGKNVPFDPLPTGFTPNDLPASLRV